MQREGRLVLHARIKDMFVCSTRDHWQGDLSVKCKHQVMCPSKKDGILFQSHKRCKIACGSSPDQSLVHLIIISIHINTFHRWFIKSVRVVVCVYWASWRCVAGFTCWWTQGSNEALSVALTQCSVKRKVRVFVSNETLLLRFGLFFDMTTACWPSWSHKLLSWDLFPTRLYKLASGSPAPRSTLARERRRTSRCMSRCLFPFCSSPMWLHHRLPS